MCLESAPVDARSHRGLLPDLATSPSPMAITTDFQQRRVQRRLEELEVGMRGLQS